MVFWSEKEKKRVQGAHARRMDLLDGVDEDEVVVRPTDFKCPPECLEPILGAIQRHQHLHLFFTAEKIKIIFFTVEKQHVKFR